jgi:hypothetical protein
MRSGFSPAKDALESYLAGRIKPEGVVIAVAAEYYGGAGRGKREALQPVIEVIDRASPGIVELGTASGGPGFDIRLAERAFPKEHEAELRRAAEAVLSGGGMREAGGVQRGEATHPASRIPHLASRIPLLASRLSHLASWIRRLFRGSASA